MSHNHNGNGQQWALEPYTACEHCGDGSGTVHVTVSCTCGYRYLSAGHTFFLDAATQEDAEKKAVEYTHAGWDVYLPAPVPVVYWITDMETGEETQYSEVCGPKQEDEPECTDADGHVWADVADVDDDEYIEVCDEGEMRPSAEIDYCKKCGRYRAYYRAEPERGLPRFFKYSNPKAK